MSISIPLYIQDLHFIYISDWNSKARNNEQRERQVCADFYEKEAVRIFFLIFFFYNLDLS